MSKRKDRTLTLILGIFLGIIIAGSVFWWQRSLHSTDWVSFRNIREYAGRIWEKQDDVLSQIRTKISGEGKRMKIKEIQPNNGDSFVGDSNNPEHYTLDTLADYSGLSDGGLEYFIDYESLPDSIMSFDGPGRPMTRRDSFALADSLRKILRYSSSPAGEVVVRRDQLLTTRIISIAGLSDTTGRASRHLDSLLTDDRGPKRISNQLRVEFWKSPINYRGYKFSRNLLVIFGIDDFENISLEYINQAIYLRHRNRFLMLETSADFRPLALTIRPDLLEKIPKP